MDKFASEKISLHGTSRDLSCSHRKLRRRCNACAEELPGWAETANPTRNCLVGFIDWGFSVSIPAGPQDMNPRLEVANASRAMQTVERDLLYEVCVSDFPQPQAKSGVNGHLTYLAAGIFLWQDDRNILRWTRTASGEANAVFMSCEQDEELYEQGQFVGGGNFPMQEKPTPQRLERREDQLMLSASYDNSTWRKVLQRRYAMRSELKIGLIGLNIT